MRSSLAIAVLAVLLVGCVQVEVGGGGGGAGDGDLAEAPSPAGRSGSPTTGGAAGSASAGGLQPSFTTDPAQPEAGQVVLFDLTVSGLSSGDKVATVRWTFGDGGVSNDHNPWHTYAEAGSFDVTVDVTTSKGARASQDSTLVVLPPGTAPAPAGPGQNETGADNGTREPEPFEPQEPSGSCGSLGSFEPIAPDPLLASGLATGWPLLELDLALIADPSFVAAHPADWEALLRDLVADASAYYEPQMGLRLNASLVDRLPDGSLEAGRDDGQQRAVARGYMHANHPGAKVDAVAVILGSNYEGSVAGQVECVHGAAYPDYSYLWAEYDEERVADPPSVGFFEDIPLKILMHELAHLLAAHHHYSTCGHPYAQARTSDLLGVCDVMINDIGLASFYFGPTNRLVARSFVEQIGIGEPV